MEIYRQPEISSKAAFRYRMDNPPEPVRAIRYYRPVEICGESGSSGLYHYGCFVYPTTEIAAVGYCADGCTGHSSKEGAREHYRVYLTDRFGHYNRKCNSPSSCSVCGRSTTHHAWVEYHYDWDTYPLCQAHMNNAGLRHVFTFKDYYLLQISDPHGRTFSTVFDQEGPISITEPAMRLTFTDLDAPKI